MLDSPPMALAAPADVIDALNALLEAEVNSVFRFIEDGSPYLNRATAEVRLPMTELAQRSRKHAHELASLIASLGGEPQPRQTPRMEDQYLAYLSLKFLLPKLVMEMQLIIQRYENAIRALGNGYPEVIREVSRIREEKAQYLEVLKRAAHDATDGRYARSTDATSKPAAAPKNSDGKPPTA
jgi:bacterioferritin (cytochrome b1)